VRVAEDAVLEEAKNYPRHSTTDLLNKFSKSLTTPEQQSRAKSVKVLERKIQREKKKSLQHPPEPKSFESLADLPEAYRLTNNGTSFLLDNITSDDFVGRILIFCSPFGLQLLSKSKVWSGDGTFSITPSPFYQVYTILAEVGNRSYPVVYGFLPGKSSAVYLHFFAAIFEKLPSFHLKLKRFLVDFETSVISEFTQVVGSGVTVSGCLVHFRRSLRKKI
jgi:hypothetical protein